MSTSESKVPSSGNRQGDMMAALAVMMQAHKCRDDLTPAASETTPKVLTILNWIATCFVKESEEDVVATALHAEAGEITIYIANNNGPSCSKDEENMKKFLGLLKALLGTEDQTKMVDAINDVVPSMTHDRFARKLDMLESTKLKSEPLQIPGQPKIVESDDVVIRFNRIVDRWATAGNKETSAALLKFSSKSLGMTETNDGNECLKRIFEKVITKIRQCTPPTPPNQPKRTRLQTPGQDKTQMVSRYRVYTAAALVLVGSNFFEQFGRSGDLKWILPMERDYLWILKLRRRLWRIARYAEDALNLVQEGIPFIQHVLGPESLSSFLNGGQQIKLIWVGDQLKLPQNHDKEYAMPSGPEHMKALFEHFNYESMAERRSRQFNSLWPEKLHPRLHCELQMMKYIVDNRLSIFRGCIGNSKLMCWSCHAYVNEVNKLRAASNQFVLSGTSGKPHTAWLLLDGDAPGEAVFNMAQATLEAAVEQIAETLGHRKVRSGGSDSTGSVDMGNDKSKENRYDLLEDSGPPLTFDDI